MRRSTRHRWWSALWVTAALLIGAVPPLVAEERPVITLVADEWCPYNCAADAAQPGYVVELATAVFAAAGIEVRYQPMPWARALQALAAGEVTAAIGVTRAELPAARFPVEPVGLFQGHFILPADSAWRYEGPASLEGLRLGVVNSYDYGDFNPVIDAQRARGQLAVLSGYDAIHRGLGMLVRGRLDLYVEDQHVARYNARQLGLSEQLQVGAAVGQPIPLYLAFSPQLADAERYAELWSAGIRRLRANGRLAEILGRYGVSDWH